MNCVACGIDSFPCCNAKTNKMAVNVSMPRAVPVCLIIEDNYITQYHLHVVFEFEIAILGCMNN